MNLVQGGQEMSSNSGHEDISLNQERGNNDFQTSIWNSLSMPKPNFGLV